MDSLWRFVAAAAMVAVDKGSANSINLEFWMTDLPPALKDIPVIYLAIPGSHDSMSYGITRQSELAPDAPPVLSRLYPLFAGTVVRWTRTQQADVTHQLVIGIRYFDLRVATKEGTDKFYFTHGLYADEVSGPITQIKDFLDTHPQEVVIMDFQHFYKMDGHDHSRLIAALVNMFGTRLCPRRVDLESVTIDNMLRAGQQVIIVYRHPTVYTSPRLWLPEQVVSPWPRQETARGLLAFLQTLQRQPGAGLVHQAVCTPTATFIALRWVSSLREQCAVPVQQLVYPYLRRLTPGAPRDPAPAAVNVVIADYVEMNMAEFPRIVVELNYKLPIGSPFMNLMMRREMAL